MPRQALNKATYPLQEAYAFVEYQSKIDYQVKTGKVLPWFDPKKKIKMWQDLDAAKRFAELGLGEGETLPYTVARNYLGQPFTKPDGSLRLGTIGLSVDEAMTLNIPEPGTSPSTAFSAYPVPVPIDLLPNEMLVFGKGPMGATNIEIRNTLIPDEHGTPATGGGFTDVDRATLARIESMLKDAGLGK